MAVSKLAQSIAVEYFDNDCDSLQSQIDQALAPVRECLAELMVMASALPNLRDDERAKLAHARELYEQVRVDGE